VQRTIYIKDEVWDAVKLRAKAGGVTTSAYIVSCLLSDQLDRIEGRLDELLKGLSKPSRSDKIESHKPSKADLSVEEIIEVQADAVHAKELANKEPVKVEKLKKAKEIISTWSGGYPKSKQVGKKEGKR